VQRSCPTCRGRVRGWVGDERRCPRCGSSPTDRLVSLALPVVRDLLPPLPRTVAVGVEVSGGLAAHLGDLSAGTLHLAGDGPPPWTPDLVVLAAGAEVPAELPLPTADHGGLVVADERPGLDHLALDWHAVAATELATAPGRHGLDPAATVRIGLPPAPGYPSADLLDRVLGRREDDPDAPAPEAAVEHREDVLRRTQAALARTAERHRLVVDHAQQELAQREQELAAARRDAAAATARAEALSRDLDALGRRLAATERDATRWRRLRRHPLGRAAAAVGRALRRLRRTR
jgi:hypothetical protein